MAVMPLLVPRLGVRGRFPVIAFGQFADVARDHWGTEPCIVTGMVTRK